MAFPNEEDRSSFSKYYTPTVEIKDYNVLIDLQPFHDEYFCNHYKLIAIDLSKQNSDFKKQQIDFVGKLEQNATIFFYY